MKKAYDVQIYFKTGNRWRSHVMLSEEQAQAVIQRLYALELDGKIEHEWFVDCLVVPYYKNDLDEFIADNVKAVESNSEVR
jgi:hypothetical protein